MTERKELPHFDKLQSALEEVPLAINEIDALVLTGRLTRAQGYEILAAIGAGFRLIDLTSGKCVIPAGWSADDMGLLYKRLLESAQATTNAATVLDD